MLHVNESSSSFTCSSRFCCGRWMQSRFLPGDTMLLLCPTCTLLKLFSNCFKFKKDNVTKTCFPHLIGAMVWFLTKMDTISVSKASCLSGLRHWFWEAMSSNFGIAVTQEITGGTSSKQNGRIRPEESSLEDYTAPLLR